MNEEYYPEYNEKAMIQEEVINYMEVMLEEEVHQVQKLKDARRKEIMIVLRIEHPPASEVEKQIPREMKKTLRRVLRQHPIEGV
jgi:hypothetical protein